MKKNQPLLTIAIPTYNRAKILKIALEKLLPQILPYSDKIEIVISNNASKDETEKIIDWAKTNYPELDFVIFSHRENTGYFGNFWKCRELSNGKYLWILSDNDHINEGTLDLIVSTLLKHNDIAAIYLHSFGNNNVLDNFEIINFEDIKEKHSEYALMLISAVIIYNDKSDDRKFFFEFKDNSFIGFLFFLQSLKFSKKIVIIKKPIFFQYPTKVTFDIFKAWIEDISQCIKYAESTKIISSEAINFLVNGFLERVVIHHVKTYLTYGKILGKKYGKKQELLKRLDKYYKNFEFYQKEIRPIFFKSRFNLIISSLLDKVVKKI
ncbi:MAG: glycosyltransferase family 2 protein [Ignavibacteria bacterium]|jgi:glycosyltransferase involved in cell wall biosynthesis|nr:glycosyltransferase family 2 protein [Ignavibacteria bacterium]MDH7527485.1 glycosyltransferase family 2 protein [Ignavibacteria bacterium]